MSEQNLPAIPLSEQWEYATLMIDSGATGFLGVGSSKGGNVWSSTLMGEGQISLDQSLPDILHRVGQAGWELISSTALHEERGGSTSQLGVIYIFKQRRATTEDQAIAQSIDGFKWLKFALKCASEQKGELALQALRKAFLLPSSQPMDVSSLFCARIYATIGDSENAFEEYQKAFRANPKLAEPYLESGKIHIERNEYDKAIAAFDRGLRLADLSGQDGSGFRFELMYQRAVALGLAGKVKDALAAYKTILERTPNLDPKQRAEIEGQIQQLQGRK